MRTCAACLIALVIAGHQATGNDEDRKEEDRKVERARILRRELEVTTAQIEQIKQTIAHEAVTWQAKVKEREARVAVMKEKLDASERAIRRIRFALMSEAAVNVKKDADTKKGPDAKLDLILKKLESLENRVKNLEKSSSSNKR